MIYDRQNRGSQAYIELGKEFLVCFGSEEDREKIEKLAGERGVMEETEVKPREEAKVTAPTEKEPQEAFSKPSQTTAQEVASSEKPVSGESPQLAQNNA